MALDNEYVLLERRVLSENDRKAQVLRSKFTDGATLVLNLISSPGAGKTSLVCKLAQDLKQEGYRVAVLVGDCATDNDAKRIAASGALVRQIITEDLCHLEAQMIIDHLADWDLAEIDVLLIENVGNLVCPSGFDLGENLKVALTSTTEGEDKPLKYPALFSSANLVVITKMDLSEICETDLPMLVSNIQQVNPDVEICFTSCCSNDGVHELAKRLMEQLEDLRQLRQELLLGIEID